MISEVINTTSEHPFYVKEQGFVNACELKIGDELLDTEQNVLIVENTYFEICENPVKVYNFEAEDFHTYYAGVLSILVHNAKCVPMGHGKGEMSRKRNVQQKQRDAIAAELRRRGVPDNVIKDQIHDVLSDKGFGYQKGLAAALEHFEKYFK